MSYPVVPDRFDRYLTQIRQAKPLSAEREFELAVRYKDLEDREAAQELIIAHLPFVVRVALRYRHYLLPVQDLVQEGMIGLMKALQRFDPHKGFRLISFAVWWIKAYIKNFIVRSWSLVKLGTTDAQRKLFYRIGEIGEHPDAESKLERIRELAAELHVKEDDVIETEARLRARDWSLDQAILDDKTVTGIDLLEDPGPDQEELLMNKQAERELSVLTHKAIEKLDPRERFIINKRFLEESPWTLQQIGNHYGTTRDRIRQLEERALGKLRRELEFNHAEALLPA
ncbi:MAG: RNA polymerase factor sigma-32 [Desulfomonile tiedjei]|nr:RNA polymerase factor sigma-32 [Desulfomonile tiedjei]